MITDDFIDPEHQGRDRELLRTFYEACQADGGTADEIYLRALRAVLAFAAADRPAAVAPEAPRRPRYTRHYADGSWQGADHPGGPWRPIPAPGIDLRWRVDGPAVPESREPAAVAPKATGQPLSPAAQAIMAAIQGETSPQIIVAQAYRALAFLRLTEPNACELLFDVAQELDP